MKINYNFLAALIVMTCGFCFIAILHYTSFERHHTHDWPQEQSQATQEARNQQDIPDGALVPDTDRIKPLHSANPRQSTSAYSSKESLQHYDHKSQILMAIATIIGIVIAIVGLIFLWRTLVATQSAAQYTGETLKIAKDTLESSKRATRAELQPYLDAVLIKKPSVMIGVESDYFEIAINGKIKITNRGKTPAIHLFGNVGFIINVIISRGEVGKVGYSGTTEKQSGCSSRLGHSMLGQGDDFEFPIRFRARFPKELFDGANGTPTPDKIRVGLGLRLSFADNFVGPEKIDGRYGRRVMEYEFGPDVTREEVKPVPFLREVKPKAIDYPEEHNRLEPYIPHAYYSSGALDVIKMRKPLPDTE